MLRARGIGTEGTEKNQRSDEGVLDPVRKGWGEVGESKIVKEYPVYRIRANRYTVRYTIEGKAPHLGSSQNTYYI